MFLQIGHDSLFLCMPSHFFLLLEIGHLNKYPHLPVFMDWLYTGDFDSIQESSVMAQVLLGPFLDMHLPWAYVCLFPSSSLYLAALNVLISLRVSYLLLCRSLDICCSLLLIISWLQTPKALHFFYSTHSSRYPLLLSATSNLISKLCHSSHQYSTIRQGRNKSLGPPVDKPEGWEKSPTFLSYPKKELGIGQPACNWHLCDVPGGTVQEGQVKMPQNLLLIWECLFLGWGFIWLLLILNWFLEFPQSLVHTLLTFYFHWGTWAWSVILHPFAEVTVIVTLICFSLMTSDVVLSVFVFISHCICSLEKCFYSDPLPIIYVIILCVTEL